MKADDSGRVLDLVAAVQRIESGHRSRLVLSAGDAAYAGNAAVLPVEVSANPVKPDVLVLPVVSGGF